MMAVVEVVELHSTAGLLSCFMSRLGLFRCASGRSSDEAGDMWACEAHRSGPSH